MNCFIHRLPATETLINGIRTGKCERCKRAMQYCTVKKGQTTCDLPDQHEGDHKNSDGTITWK